MITLKTNYGTIVIELDFENTPNTANNFVEYVKNGFYNGTIFHRVIKEFMIQGGGFNTGMEKKSSGDSIENEAEKGGKNTVGSIAMARTSDPHSASSQFFINTVDNTFLNYKAKTDEDWGYCVFGKVTDGMDVVEKIAKVSTGSQGGHGDVPVDDVVIENVTVDN